jgi:hypothetical protein
MKKAKMLGFLICLAIVALGSGAAFAALIPNVPDVQQPPTGSLGNPTDNACAPVSAVNITQYWDVVMGHPNALTVNAGLAPATAADYLYYFMNTDDWPLPGPPRMNGTPPMYPSAPGTYNIDIMPGFLEFVRWDAAHMFTTPPPALPAGKLGYDWTFNTDYATGFLYHVAQIDSGHPDIVCFTYWNPMLTPVKVFEPALGDTVYFYMWGSPISNSGPPNPIENWNSNTGPEGIGHAVTGIGYYANYSPGGGLPVTNWIVCHDNWPTTRVNVAIPWANWKATITANPGEEIEPPDSLYWKDYNDTLQGGYMPDFDQNQDFNGDLVIDPGYCGPVSVANSLWWFQGKYLGQRTIIDPIFYPANPIGFIQHLAILMKTNRNGMPPYIPNGTYVDSMQAGIAQYLQMMNITDLLYEHTIYRPTFDTVEAEIERCQDVTLLIGFWVVMEVYEQSPGQWMVIWKRTGGHYVTAAGVNSQDRFIGISDPAFDNFENGITWGVLRGVNHNHPTGHNDGVSASHDIYHVNDSLVCSPGGLWEFDHAFWRQPILQTQFAGQNEDSMYLALPWPCPQPPVVGELYSEVEAAVIVSPYEGVPRINVIPDLLNYIQLVNTSNTYNDQIVICNAGTATLTVDSVRCDLSWVTTSFAAITLSPGACDTIDVTINTNMIVPGVYSGFFHVYSSDPLTPIVNKPSISVQVTAPDIQVTPDSIFHSQLTNTIVNYNNDFTINNTGDATLTYTATNTIPWITLIGLTGSIPAGGADQISLNVNTTGIAPGIYIDSVTINSDDPDTPILHKPKIVIQVRQIPIPDSLYWKDYNDTLEGGYMPDFDQKQDFTGDGLVDPGYCGPVSIANSLWWFQGKYPDRIIVPPSFYPMNPIGFIQMLATLMKTTPGGTYVDSMQWGIQQYLNMMGLNDLLYEHTVWQPSFQYVEAEIERCQDVTLLVGFWVIEEIFEDMPGHYLVLWRRTGGHYVTSAGVNSQDRFIGLSDPFFDNFEGGVCYGVLRGFNHNHPQGHNDGVSASHDIYNINDTIVCSPGGIWELDHPFWHSPMLQTQFYNQNEGQRSMMLPWTCPNPPVLGALYSEIEAAVIVSPFELPKINVVPESLSYVQLISTNNTYTDQIIISNVGGAPLNVTAMSCDLSWVTFSFVPVTLLPGSADTVDVIINTTGILPGPYNGNCHISSNDPLTPIVNKPHIRIRVTAPNIGVSPDSLYHSQQTNTNVTYNSDFAISNSGDGDLLITSATNTLPWVSLIGVPFAIPPAGNVPININVNTAGILPGIYLDSVTIMSNDPIRSILRKPKIVINVTPPQQVDSLFWKDYNGPEVAEGYMPDFDQNQDFNNDGSIDLGYCGPVSVANSFWWYQGKYPDKQIILPGFYPGNPLGFIQVMALLMKTNATANPGTDVDTMQAGIRQYIQMMHLDTLFYEHTIKQPTFDTIVTELVRCQDVTLLLGFWYIEEVIPVGPGQWLINWRRTGGHYVTVAGVNEQEGLIGISDPDADNFEMGICSGVLRGLNHIHPAGHNDGVSASHDVYNIGVPPCSPGGLWELEHAYWHSQHLLTRYANQNGGMFMVTVPWQCPQIEPMVGAIYTEIEAAVIVSPRQPIPCAYKPGDINGDDVVIGGDVTYGVRYFKGIGSQPPDSCWNDSTQNWLYAAGDVNGNCEFRGSDITFLVAYFKSIQPALKWCRWTPPIVLPPAINRDGDKAIEPMKVIPSQSK